MIKSCDRVKKQSGRSDKAAVRNNFNTDGKWETMDLPIKYSYEVLEAGGTPQRPAGESEVKGGSAIVWFLGGELKRKAGKEADRAN